MFLKENWKILLTTLLSLVGLIDSAYLTAVHSSGHVPGCSLVEGCDVVLQSSYSTIAGIPTALFGVLFYFVVFVLSIFILANKDKIKKLSKILAVWGTLGFLATLGFVLLQAFVINAWCQFCLLSAVTSTLIFITAWCVFYKNKKNGNNKDKNEEGESIEAQQGA